MNPGNCKSSKTIAIKGNRKLQNNKLYLLFLEMTVFTTMIYEANQNPSGSE